MVRLADVFVQSICCGYGHTLCLTKNGEVIAWGNNDFGQIGCDSEKRYISEPTYLKFCDEKIIAISSGFYHCLALSENGRVYGWGNNQYGQLGIGNKEDVYKPKLIDLKGISIKMISCGMEHSLFLSNAGAVYASGSNKYSQISNKKKEDFNFPLKIELSFTVTQIAAHFGSEIAIAESENGRFFVWGKCGNKIITSPLGTTYRTLNEIFYGYHQISYGIIKGSFVFNDTFLSNGKYQVDFKQPMKISSGSFGSVFKCLKSSENKIYAVKIIPFEEKFESVFIKELETSSVIAKLSDDRLVQYYDFWFEKDYEYRKVGDRVKYDLAFFIQMEYCSKTMQDMINQIQKFFKSGSKLNLFGYYIASELFLEILDGVNYLHKLDPPIIHRDLKPKNILVTDSRKGRFVKIADFGSIALHRFKDESHTEGIGTIQYLAPEVMEGRKYDTKADVYSLGILMKNLFLNNVNEDDDDDDVNIIDETLRMKYHCLNDLCDRMLFHRYRNRPTCEEILEKQTWALKKTEFNCGKELSSSSISKTSEFSLYSIIMSKLMGTNYSNDEIVVKHCDSPKIGTLYYQMSCHERGKCLIINNETKAVYRESEFQSNIFSQLHFKVQMEKNLKPGEILSLLSNLYKGKYSDKCDAFVVMIITQAEDEKLFGFDGCENNIADDFISIIDVVDIFSEEKCPALRQKPKLFFFNCFRLSLEATSVRPKSDVTDGLKKYNFQTINERWLNQNRDTFIVYSCSDGYNTFHDPKRGVSHFGQILGEALGEHACDKTLMNIINLTVDQIESTYSNDFAINLARRELPFNPGFLK